MAKLLSSLPGDILGLLQRGSPVHWRDEQTPYVAAWVGPWPDADIDDGAIVQAAPSGYGLICIEDTAKNFALDLADPTGRVHAAWWVVARVLEMRGLPRDHRSDWRKYTFTDPEHDLLILAQQGADMTPTQIDALARLVLRLAGRSHV